MEHSRIWSENLFSTQFRLCPIYLKKLIFVLETIYYYISTKTYDQTSYETCQFQVHLR